MIKQTAALSLVVVLLSGLMNSYSLLINYSFNKESITELFCVNKDKPSVKCNGKCHLGKQLNATSEKKSDNQKKLNRLTLSDFLVEKAPFKIITTSFIYQPFVFDYSSKIKEGHRFQDLPPPRFS